MNKRADIAHRRLNDMLEFRARAKAAIIRKLRPDLAAIYAGDSNALERLAEKITTAEADQDRMKKTNAIIRKFAKAGQPAQVQALLEMGYQLATATELLKGDCLGRIGFADFELTNNGANIRRMKERLEHITKLKAIPTTEKQGTVARMEDCPQDNRVRLFFPGKPDQAIRADLKSSGFRWTPSMGCWQAYRNNGSYWKARRVAGIPDQQPQAQAA